MRNKDILPILIILFLGFTAGNAILKEDIKSPPVTFTTTIPDMSTSKVVIDLNTENMQISSTAQNQPEIFVNVLANPKIVKVPVPVIQRDTISLIVVRKDLHPLKAPQFRANKPEIPNSIVGV